MKKQFTLAFSLLAAFSLQSSIATATVKPPDSNLLWSVQNQWKLKSKPLDVVHTLDGKQVFVLTDQNSVQIYNTSGTLVGTVPVSAGVSAIDIEPRGELLYLIDSKKNTFSSLSIDFIKDINTVGSPFKGKADAPITVTVFTDFE